ncbi:hypothetical protein PHYBLDRAFT_173201 [Phycomyces blakesleeanus NRRL 1555(-)]|uniref:Uncharacterized protein n=1 Tax=Phycomyces blakesleeanus (strain ATCC 8743b / DSM 1359 / FGSC 10004 / NBRC 33097 / NRRL 1555) TaxID=763407 RepID=A0A167KSM4_PHYB8|nr:hypothetical protein PHYBLDRAFT_173201 [Phycomyces blakesleeanus NRRL 1555(-)]OAD68786.1 hypothetical protein PHYBLDRAFT_173201 [Phycomyces blakesleeanus NRRL 1555(-)]|eukprot:XP_018286826.1 hypothetical protein PHYBLDRAFT_173201 [Phycomyces blakesleeanus NRRL 1555(-)]
MFKSSFNKLYEIIKDHSLYKSPKGHKQTDVKLQLALVLERLGSDGNAVSYSRLAQRSGVGEGSVLNFTVRFFKTDDMMTMTMKISWEKKEKEEIERISREGVTGTVDDYPAMSLSDENAKLKRIHIKEEILIKNGDGNLLKKIKNKEINYLKSRNDI